MNKRVAHTAELIANLRTEQVNSLSSLRGIPTGETITSRNDTALKRMRPAKPRPLTTRASTPSASLYGKQTRLSGNRRTLDVSQSHYDLTKRIQRQQYRQNALMALLGGMLVGLALTLI